MNVFSRPLMAVADPHELPEQISAMSARAARVLEPLEPCARQQSPAREVGRSQRVAVVSEHQTFWYVLKLSTVLRNASGVPQRLKMRFAHFRMF